MSETLTERLAGEIEEIFEPLVNALDSPFWSDRLFSQLGVGKDDPSAGAILAALDALVELKNQISALAANPSPSFDGIAQVLNAFKGAFDAIRSLSNPGAAAAAFAGFGEDLVELLIGTHVASRYPLPNISALTVTVLIAGGRTRVRRV